MIVWQVLGLKAFVYMISFTRLNVGASMGSQIKFGGMLVVASGDAATVSVTVALRCLLPV